MGKATNPAPLKKYIELVGKENPQLQVGLQGGGKTTILPSTSFNLRVDSAAVASYIPEAYRNRMVKDFTFSIKKGQRAVFKGELALLDILAHNDWERPIYFNNTSASNVGFDLKQYMFLEGMTYRLLPVKANSTDGGVGEINVDQMLANIEQFSFRGFDNPDTYNDEEYRKFGINARHHLYRLANALYIRGDSAKAIEVLDYSIDKIRDTVISYTYFTPRYVDLYAQLGEYDKSDKLGDKLYTRSSEVLEFLTNAQHYQNDEMRQISLITLNQLRYVYANLAARFEVGSLERNIGSADAEVLISSKNRKAKYDTLAQNITEKLNFYGAK